MWYCRSQQKWYCVAGIGVGRKPPHFFKKKANVTIFKLTFILIEIFLSEWTLSLTGEMCPATCHLSPGHLSVNILFSNFIVSSDRFMFKMFQHWWFIMHYIWENVLQTNKTKVHCWSVLAPVSPGCPHGHPGRGLHLPAHGLLWSQWYTHTLVLLLPGSILLYINIITIHTLYIVVC